MPSRYVTHRPLPEKSAQSPNWLNVERNWNADLPTCVGATGNPGTIASGTPGVASFVSWTQPSALYDRFNFTGQADATMVRIPVDGFYDFWMMWEVDDDIHGNNIEFKTFMDGANTSSTGIGSPSWSRLITGPSRDFLNENIDLYFEALYRGVELHANDVVRFGVQTYTSQTLTTTIITHSEFRFTYPIPNEAT